MGEARDEKERLLRETVIRKGLATASQVEDCHRTRGKSEDLGALLVKRGILAPGQLARVSREVDTALRRGAKQDPFVGQVFGGDFRLVRLLGSGGMGAVYLARQLSLERDVAVKLLPFFAGVADAKLVERFRREAVAAARLSHPNIVQVYSLGQQTGQYFIAMEYVEGETLLARVQREGKVSAEAVVRIGLDLAAALAAAHGSGLVHRDVKPGNVFLLPQGAAKLGDFGLVRDIAESKGLTTTGHAMGTPHYMSPEQTQGKKTDPRSDLYSLGATLFHALTGRTPYEGTSFVELARRHASDPVPSVSAFGHEVPRRFVVLVRKLLAKRAADRPASAEDVIAALSPLSR